MPATGLPVDRSNTGFLHTPAEEPSMSAPTEIGLATLAASLLAGAATVGASL